jgi:hypothetical protein
MVLSPEYKYINLLLMVLGIEHGLGRLLGESGLELDLLDLK